MPSRQTLLLQCLEAAGRAAGGEDRWVSARAVARRLSPTANHEAIARDLGHAYYRNAP